MKIANVFSNNSRKKSVGFVALLVLALLVGSMTARGAFALAPPPSVTATPSTFGSGASIVVTGSGFQPGSTVRVWLDLNSNGREDFGEPVVTATVDSTGSFSATLNVGSVAVGSYSIDAASGFFAAALASTPVTVVDTSTLASIATSQGVLQTAITDLKTQLNSIGGYLITDIDSKLGSLHSGDTVASLLYQIKSNTQASGPQVVSGSGICELVSTSNGANCDTTYQSGEATFSPSAQVTLTMYVFSCASGTCSENQLEAGGQVSVGISNGIATDVYPGVYYCNGGTCGTSIQTLTFSGTQFQILGGCDSGTLGLNSCSDLIQVYYSYTAIVPPCTTLTCSVGGS